MAKADAELDKMTELDSPQCVLRDVALEMEIVKAIGAQREN